MTPRIRMISGGKFDVYAMRLQRSLPYFPHVHPDQSLDLALERMGANQLDVLPVVNRANVHKLEGIVTLRDVLNSYGVSPSDGA